MFVKTIKSPPSNGRRIEHVRLFRITDEVGLKYAQHWGGVLILQGTKTRPPKKNTWYASEIGNGIYRFAFIVLNPLL